MNKKISLKYIVLLLIIVITTNCDLERVPQDKISSTTFWKTESDAVRALMGCYTYVPPSMNNPYYDGFADNAYCQYPWESKATDVSSGSISSDMDGRWQPKSEKYNYEGVRRFNYFLDNIDKAPMSENLKNQFKAEVRVLRSWYYFKLLKKFGPIPLITKYTEVAEDVQIKPSSETKAIEFLVKEISESIKYLSETPDHKSRISKDAAWVLKSRIHLFANQWQEAVDASLSVINKNKYNLFGLTSLSDDDMKDDYSAFIDFKSEEDKKDFMLGLRSYEKMFWDANQGNEEVIFEVEYIKESQWSYSSGLNTLLFSDNAGGGWSSITPTVPFVNSYWSRDGKWLTALSKDQRAEKYLDYNKYLKYHKAVKDDNSKDIEKYKAFKDKKYKEEYLSEFKNRDTRLYASVMFPSSIWNALEPEFKFYWNKGGNNTSKTGYNFRKLADPTVTRENWKAPQNFIAMRYAEVLLNYAEAQNELSGPNAEVFNALDKIRERVAMPKVDRASNGDKGALRETIRNERRIELALEGFRWDDIRRWGIAKDVMKTIYAIDGDLAQERRWEDRFVRLPYPQEAVDRNPNLKEAQAAKGY